MIKKMMMLQMTRVRGCRQHGSKVMQCCYCVIIFDVNDEIAETAFLRVGTLNLSTSFTINKHVLEQPAVE